MKTLWRKWGTDREEWEEGNTRRRGLKSEREREETEEGWSQGGRARTSLALRDLEMKSDPVR
jgi:hypothetical protein